MNAEPNLKELLGRIQIDHGIRSAKIRSIVMA